MKTGEIVFCIVCFVQHEAEPEPREDEFGGQTILDGVWARDYTYYVDSYKGSVGPICWEHDRDEISERKMKDIDTEYKNNGLSL